MVPAGTLATTAVMAALSVVVVAMLARVEDWHDYVPTGGGPDTATRSVTATPRNRPGSCAG